jgi:uncharacterized membrane protein (UPF0136 family)
MGNLRVEDMLQLLELGTGLNALWSIFLYIIFFFALFTLFTMPDKNMVPTMLIAVVLLCAVIAKISLAASRPIFQERDFGMMIINIATSVLPFVVAGMIRRGKSRQVTAVPLAIITGIAGSIYALLFLLFVQRG